jgi:hypothetical protein
VGQIMPKEKKIKKFIQNKFDKVTNRTLLICVFGWAEIL